MLGFALGGTLLILSCVPSWNIQSCVLLLGTTLLLDYVAPAVLAVTLDMSPATLLVSFYAALTGLFALSLAALSASERYRVVVSLLLRIRGRKRVNLVGYLSLAPATLLLGVIPAAAIIWGLGLNRYKASAVVLLTGHAASLAAYAGGEMIGLFL